MNTQLLEKVKAKAQAFPEAFDMGVYVLYVKRRKEIPCGTVGCIAGHALVESGQTEIDGLFCALRARKVLEITEKQAARLFYTDDWPPTLAARFMKAETAEQRASTICERIDRFIRTKGKA